MTRAGSHGRHRRRRWVARGLLVALLSPACGAPPREASRAPITPLRGISPAGPATLPITFSWRGNTDEGVVRVSIEDRAQRPVFAFPARGSSATPDGLEAVLTPGESFSWTVAAVDENGTETRRSTPVSFARAEEVRQ
jgi:hypothetical protein